MYYSDGEYKMNIKWLDFFWKDIRQLIPYVCDSHSSSGETGEFPTLSTDNVRIEGTTNEDTPDVSLQPNSAEPEGFFVFITPLKI